MLVQNNGVDSLLYAYSDFQGSLIALADVNGNVVEKYAYDPWGARRDPNDWTQKDIHTKWITNRGYTGHEHIDAFGIINMNGRVYDPATGMFMSPDPYVQAPKDWLNYNRYSYCMGNPFKYTDPSGNFWFFRLISGIFGAVIVTPLIFTLEVISGANIGKAAKDAWNGGAVALWSIGKECDQFVFGTSSKGTNYGNTNGYNSAETDSPGALKSWYARDANGNMQNYNYYEFDNLNDMTNYMWKTTQSINKEIVGYVLTDSKGKTTYYVLDWKNGINDATHSDNPYSSDKTNGRSMFNGKYIAGEIHTHPDLKRSDNAYDGPSYADYDTASKLGVPVYTIGSTGVSVVTPKGISDSSGKYTYTTEEEYDHLGYYHYDINDLTIDGRRSVNPFYITDTISWLQHPYLLNSIFP